MKKDNFNFLYIILFFWILILFKDYWDGAQQVETVPYSEFKSLLQNGQISEVVVSEKYIHGELKNPRPNKKKKIMAVRVEEELSKQLSQYGVKYSRTIESGFLRDLLSWVLPVLFFFLIWMYLGRKIAEKGGGLGGGLLSVSKSRAKIYVETDVKTTFADVAGVDEAKEELKEVVNFLKFPEKYGKLGARMPKGILLVGPPGTGKTLLAKAIAGEASVAFFSISGAEFVELFVGVGAARVRDLFTQARQKAPCIIFIDELDALGKARSIHSLSGGHDEKEQTLNQLLAELDGFDSRTGVVLLAATNRPEILDPALLRAGRFDKQILVDRPDKKGRQEILNVHVKKIKLAAEMTLSLEEVAAMTPGFSGAELANLVNEAALTATRRGAETVSMRDFTEAIERIVAGLERKNRLLFPLERKVVAYHEMGHALVASVLPGTDKVHKISIIPRGIGALGYTIQRPTEDRYLMTKEELMNRMAVLLGGRSAEILIFGQASTGASDDLIRATDIARNIVVRYGMSEKLGPIAYELGNGGYLGQDQLQYQLGVQKKIYSEETAREIDCEVKKLVEAAAALAVKILQENVAVLEKGAQQLLAKETLHEGDLKELLKTIHGLNETSSTFS